MAPVSSLLRVALIGLIALTSVAAAPAEKLALSASEVNLIEYRAAGSATEPSTIVALYSGSAMDPPGLEGLSWVTATLIARQAGDGIAVTVTRDMTLFDLSAPAARQSQVVRGLARVMLKPTITPEQLEVIRQEALNAIESLRHDPGRLATEAFMSFAFRGHPYAHPPTGTVSGLARLTPDDALAHHSREYRQGNLAVAVPDSAEKGALSMIRSEYSALPEGEPARESRWPALLPRPRFLVIESPEAPPAGAIMIGHPTWVTTAHPDYFSLQAAIGWVIDRPAETSLPLQRQPVIMLAPGGNLPDHTAAVTALLARLRVVEAAGIPDDRIEGVKASLASRTVSAESAALLRLAEYLHGSPGLAARREASIAQVTAESARSAGVRHLFAGRVAIVAVVASSDRFVAEMLESPGMRQTGIALFAAGPVRNDFEIRKAADLFIQGAPANAGQGGNN